MINFVTSVKMNFTSVMKKHYTKSKKPAAKGPYCDSIYINEEQASPENRSWLPGAGSQEECMLEGFGFFFWG